jgi:hypothetical protein
MSNSKLNTSSSTSELLRRVEFTSKARYNGARRLGLHNIFSQWTLAYLAVGQIAISMVPALKLHNNFSEDYTNFGAIFFGVLVLAYSLLLGMGNFSTRSVVMHSCGMELGNLARELHLLNQTSDVSPSSYESAANDYYQILSKCENHAHQDYLATNASLKLNALAWPPILNNHYIADLLACTFAVTLSFVLKVLHFAHYLATVAMISFWFHCMIKTTA